MNRRALIKYTSLWMAGTALPLESQTRQPEQPGVACNQCGYPVSARKVATVRAASAGQEFHLVSQLTGKALLSGKLGPVVNEPAAGERVTLADFSSLSIPGTYRVEASSFRSAPFVVGDHAYNAALKLVMRAFYGQRCGCAVDLGDGYQYGACHLVGAFHKTSGKTGSVPNTGGWHDAGDYGRYMVNSAVTSGTLLYGWELYPRALSGLSLAIPESGGRLPDYLAEVKWNLDWMLSQQDSDGGVWHKQTSDHFCGFVLPDQDSLTSFVIGTGTSPYKSTCATGSFSAAMAIAARCYSAYDGNFASRCLTAARQAYSWAIAHPDVAFSNPEGITTGAYADTHCSNEILWAAAELWRTTGEGHFEQAFLESAGKLSLERAITPPSWSNVTPLACWAYALAERKGDAGIRSRIVSQTSAAAQFLAARSLLSGYGNTLAPEDYVWGSNGVAASQSLLLMVSHHLAPSPQAQQAALGNLHYLLGRNCFQVSWVTHLGSNPFQHPHHRPSVASRLPAPWPGLLSGGPNAKPSDKVGQKLGHLPPMKMWVDDAAAFSLNEVAINWNAALVFLLAAAS